MAEKKLEVGGMNFRVFDEGQDLPVLLLHGFPDSSYVWRKQIPALTAAGYRTIVPDLRGFGESARPEGVENYTAKLLLGDIIGILDDLEISKPHVIGHDWGAMLAWLLAGFSPDRVESLTVLSVGHPASMASPNIEQLLRSWYILFFQLSSAERLLSASNWWLFRKLLQNHSELQHTIPALERPGALTAALNWYRANVNPKNRPRPEAFPLVSVRTMGVWSSRDAYLAERQMLRSTQYLTGDWRYERIDDVGHWMQLDAPDRTNELILSFLEA